MTTVGDVGWSWGGGSQGGVLRGGSCDRGSRNGSVVGEWQSWVSSGFCGSRDRSAAGSSAGFWEEVQQMGSGREAADVGLRYRTVVRVKIVRGVQVCQRGTRRPL